VSLSKISPDPQVLRMEERYSPSQLEERPGVSAVAAEREEEKRMLPCRFFSNGFCHRGNRCRFYHPGMSNINNSIRVPPMPQGFGTGQLLQQNSAQVKRRPSFPSRPSALDFDDFPAPRSPGRSNSLLSAVLEQTSSDTDLCGVVTTKTVNGLVTFEYDKDISATTVRESSSGTTMFSHIDWTEFLAPGALPPPVTEVPEQGASNPSPARKGLLLVSASATSTSDHSDDSVNEDMPPEGSNLHMYGEKENKSPMDDESLKKLSAKEELQMKVKKIASELADEPTMQVRSLDSFFRDYQNIDMLPEAMLFKSDETQQQKNEEKTEDVKDADAADDLKESQGNSGDCTVELTD